MNHVPCKPKPYQAHVRHGGKLVHLGCFATAEEAALCIARSPEGQAAARRAAVSCAGAADERGGAAAGAGGAADAARGR